MPETSLLWTCRKVAVNLKTLWFVQTSLVQAVPRKCMYVNDNPGPMATTNALHGVFRLACGFIIAKFDYLYHSHVSFCVSQELEVSAIFPCQHMRPTDSSGTVAIQLRSNNSSCSTCSIRIQSSRIRPIECAPLSHNPYILFIIYYKAVYLSDS